MLGYSLKREREREYKVNKIAKLKQRSMSPKIRTKNVLLSQNKNV